MKTIFEKIKDFFSFNTRPIPTLILIECEICGQKKVLAWTYEKTGYAYVQSTTALCDECSRKDEETKRYGAKCGFTKIDLRGFNIEIKK